MVQLASVCDFLESFAPVQLAEDWDNVGLLAGDAEADISSVMTCLTITPVSAAEAIEKNAQLIVVHHPLPFRPLKKITTATTPGKLLWQLIQSGVAIYSPHTAFDSASGGINQRLAEGLGLEEIAPLVPSVDHQQLGAGRRGKLSKPMPVEEFAQVIKSFLGIEGLHIVAQADQTIQFPAVACGSAGQFLTDAIAAGCDALVTGETNFHTCLEAEAAGTALLLPGHFASERFAVEQLSAVLKQQFPALEIWTSEQEKDPLIWV